MCVSTGPCVCLCVYMSVCVHACMHACVYLCPRAQTQRWDGSTKVDSFLHNTSIEQGGIEVVGPSSPPKRMPSASGAGNNGRGSGVKMGVGWWGTNVRQHGNKDALREETLTPTTPCVAVAKRHHPMSHPSPDFSASSLMLVPGEHVGGGRVNYLRAPGNALRRKGMAALAHTSQVEIFCVYNFSLFLARTRSRALAPRALAPLALAPLSLSLSRSSLSLFSLCLFSLSPFPLFALSLLCLSISRSRVFARARALSLVVSLSFCIMIFVLYHFFHFFHFFHLFHFFLYCFLFLSVSPFLFVSFLSFL